MLAVWRPRPKTRPASCATNHVASKPRRREGASAHFDVGSSWTLVAVSRAPGSQYEEVLWTSYPSTPTTSEGAAHLQLTILAIRYGRRTWVQLGTFEGRKIAPRTYKRSGFLREIGGAARI